VYLPQIISEQKPGEPVERQRKKEKKKQETSRRKADSKGGVHGEKEIEIRMKTLLARRKTKIIQRACAWELQKKKVS